MSDKVLIKNGLQQYTDVSAELWAQIQEAQGGQTKVITFRGRVLGLRQRNKTGANGMPSYNMVYARFFAGDKALGATWVRADDDIYVID